MQRRHQDVHHSCYEKRSVPVSHGLLSDTESVQRAECMRSCLQGAGKSGDGNPRGSRGAGVRRRDSLVGKGRRGGGGRNSTERVSWGWGWVGGGGGFGGVGRNSE